MTSSEVGTEAQSKTSNAARAWSNPFLTIARLFIFGLWTAYCYTACVMARAVASDRGGKRAVAAEWTHRWLRSGAPLVGIRIEVHGAPPKAPALLAPNHTGYLDILAVGAACPTVFVSRADVRSWPVIGQLFTMSEHIGITRSDRRSLTSVNDSIAERLEAGQRVCVFLEGTSSDGSGLLPFHASLVQPAVQTRVPIVPIGLHWQTDAKRVSVSEDVAYWRPEHNFATHAWRALGLRGIHVTLTFGDPVPPGGDRKALAAQTRHEVARLLGLDDTRA